MPHRLSRCLSPLRPLAAALLVLLTVAAATTAAAANPPAAELTDTIESIVARYYPVDGEATGPGAAVLVVRDGETLLRKGYGMADIEMGVPIDPGMVFRIGSVTKQFTAVAILMLMEEGKLTLDDPITRFLPDYPTQGKTITIEHLLTHTSGIKSYTGQDEFLPEMRRDYTVEEMIDRFDDEAFDFEPGDRFLYNNSGYFLLGAVIEKASGMSYEEFLRQRIFEPLEMKSSYLDRHERIIPGRAEGYQKNPEGITNAPFLSMTQPYAAGAILSTVDDLAKWDAALYGETLVERSSLEKAWTSYRLADGSATGYGFGWGLGEWRGSPVVQHSGGIHGFLSIGVRLPEQKAYIAILSNLSGAPPGPSAPAFEIAAQLMGEPWNPQKVELPEATLQSLTGVYRIDEETTRIVTYEDGRLVTQRSGGSKTPAYPMSETEFFYEDAVSYFEIERNDAGEVTGMVMHTMGSPPERAAYTDEKPTERKAIELDPALLDNYLGRYQLAPGFVLEVTREGNELWTQATGQPKFQVYPESETRFFLKVVDAQLEFDLDENGKATGLTLHQAGQHIPGKKLEE